MSNPDTPIIKFLFNQDWKALSDAISMGSYPEEAFTTAQELISFIQCEERPALIFCSLTDKKDLIQIATLVKLSKKATKDPGLKLVVVNFSGNKQFELAAQKIGIQEIMTANVNSKSLRFKINLWMKNLATHAPKPKNVVKENRPNEQVKNQQEKKTDTGLIALPPMMCPDDIWLTHRDLECKKILGRWLVRLVGPSPYVAQWVEAENNPGVWKFEFREGNRADFMSGSGDWFFRGDQKPDFNWKENIWYMTGETFDLFYYDTAMEQRFQLQSQKLSLAANSPQALEMEKLIIETFDKDLVFKKSLERLKNMDGESKGDRLQSDHLSLEKQKDLAELEEEFFKQPSGPRKPEDEAVGKVNPIKEKTSPEKLAATHSEAKDFSPKPFHPSGPAGLNNNKDQRGLSASKDLQINSPSREGLNQHKSGSEASEEDREQGARTARAQKDKASPFANMQRESSSDSSADYSGEGKTEDLGRGSYQGKVSTEGKSEAEEKKREHTPADKLEDLHGKNKTDQLQHKNLQGKSKGTDDLGTDPLELKLNQQQDQPSDHSLSLDKQKGLSNLAGKGKTDHSVANPLAGKNKAEGDVGSDPLSMKLKPVEQKPSGPGKGSTDHLDQQGREGVSQKGPADGSLLDLENKNHTHETKYKGHLEAEKFEAKEGRKNQYGKEEDSDGLSGKSETSKLSKHYGNKQTEPNEREANNSDPLSGRTKQSAEKLKSHLQGKAKAASLATDKERSSQLEEDEAQENSHNVIPFQKPFNPALESLKTELQGAPDPELDEISQTALVTATLTQGNVTTRCQLDDFYDGTVIFQVTGTKIDLASVDVDLSLDYQGQQKRVKFTAVVSSSDEVEEVSFVSVDIGEKDQGEFDSFMDLYRRRQENATRFLQRAKGI